ncbi:EAL domain-containing protein [Sphingomonas sp. ST-64]|uniref:EAL domain-containing protein n=1 Tax=Sphingomonas plantiphila TaxID=3163295 RepID=A0ABW8YLG6_9SPHN
MDEHEVNYGSEGPGGPAKPDLKNELAAAMHELRSLRRQHSYLVHNVPGVVYRCEVHPPWRMLFVNNRVETLTGYRREEFEGGKPWAELIHPDDLQHVEAVVAEAVSRRGEFLLTYRLFDRFGRVKWVREQGQISSADGAPPYFLDGFIDDITEQRLLTGSVTALEAQARQRSAILASVLEGTSDCVYSLDRDWRFTYLNGKALEYFNRGNLTGRSIFSVFPDGRHSSFRDALKRAMEGGVPAFAAGYLESSNSWYELQVTPIEQGITVFFRDVSERMRLQERERQAAERWRSALDVMPQMVWSIAHGARAPDYYNDRWYEFTGLPRGTTGGDEWAGVYHPEDLRSALEAWRHCRASGEPYEAEYRLRDRNGHYRWVVSRARAERSDTGKILRWYGTYTDVHERHLQREALETSERRAHAILDSVPQIIWVATPDGRLDFLSEQWNSVYGGNKGAILGSGWLDWVHPDDCTSTIEKWRACLASGLPYEAEFRVQQINGEYLWTLVRALPERNAEGEIVRWYGTCTDIDELVRAREERDRSAALNRGIVEAAPDCISVLDIEGTVLFVNGATINAYGAPNASLLVGKRWGRAFKKADRSKAGEALAQAQAGDIGRLVIRGGPEDSHWYDVVLAPINGADGKPINVVVISRDFTEQKEAEEKVQWAANHDALTHLPNRFLLQKRLEEQIANSDADRSGFTLLIIDIDHLKRVNDGIGHDAGDALLREVANRLTEAVRCGDMVARLGGDEFAILLPGLREPTEIQEVEQAILARLTEPFSYAGRLLECQGSMGASIYPEHGNSRVDLLKNADVALYAAKSSLRGKMVVFEPSMRNEIQRRSSMLSLAKAALRNGWLVPYYQPKIDLRSGRILGFEALLRWKHPERGLQLPNTIAAAFDDLDLAAEISDQMIGKVIADTNGWRKRGIQFGHVAVNAAAAEFRRGDFVHRLLENLEKAAIPVSEFQVEVTETVFLGRGAEYVEQTLRDLSAAGVKIALDDFGTGFASLSHLNHFPVDYIKIDRSFVENIDASTGAPIIDAIINLGRALGIEIVAEGIETLTQHDFLLRRGCQYAQGFLYSQAVSADEVPATLKLLEGGALGRWINAA